MAAAPDWDIIDFATKVSKFVEANFKWLLAVVVAVIIGGAFLSWQKSQTRQAETDAFAKLYPISKAYQKRVTEFAQAEEEAAQQAQNKTQPKDKAPGLKKSGDLNTDFGSIVTDLQSFVEQNQKMNAGAEAALLLAEIYEEYREPAKGAAALQGIVMPTASPLGQVVAMRLGDLWASANNCEKAIEAWKPLAEQKNFISEPAQLKLGVCLQEVGRLQEAKTWFEKIRAQSPNSVEGFNAKRYLRYLEFRLNNPEDGRPGSSTQTTPPEGQTKS